MQLYLLFVLILVMLFIVVVVLRLQKKKSDAVRLKSSSPTGEGEPELVIAPGYLHKLEGDIQNALEAAVRSAASGMREELASLLKEVSQQNTSLIAEVREFETTFQEKLKAEVINLQQQFTTDNQAALAKLHEQNRELVASVQRVEEEAKKQFRETLLASTSEVSEGLTRTIDELRKEMITVVKGAIKRELEAFHDTVLEAQKSTIQSLGRIYEDVGKQKEALEKEVAADVAETKKQLLERLEKNFNTIILQFLRENLGDTLDLAHQEKYIIKMLEEHKEKLIQELHDEV